MTNRSRLDCGGISVLSFGIMVLAAVLLGGCAPKAQMTPGTVAQKYPYNKKLLRVDQVQVFRDGSNITLYNQTTHAFSDFNLWLNERFVRHVASLPVAGSLKLSLFEFIDQYGEPFRGGGFFTGYLPDPVLKAEMETPDGMVGFVVIPNKDDQ